MHLSLQGLCGPTVTNVEQEESVMLAWEKLIMKSIVFWMIFISTS